MGAFRLNRFRIRLGTARHRRHRRSDHRAWHRYHSARVNRNDDVEPDENVKRKNETGKSQSGDIITYGGGRSIVIWRVNQREPPPPLRGEVGECAASPSPCFSPGYGGEGKFSVKLLYCARQRLAPPGVAPSSLRPGLRQILAHVIPHPVFQRRKRLRIATQLTQFAHIRLGEILVLLAEAWRHIDVFNPGLLS